MPSYFFLPLVAFLLFLLASSACVSVIVLLSLAAVPPVGVNVTVIKIVVYAVSGLLSALAGIILTARLESAQPTAGVGYELDAIAAVVVGGTSLAGGIGSMTGTLIGALIIGILNNALNLMDVSAYYQMIAKGAVILLAVLVDRRGAQN